MLYTKNVLELISLKVKLPMVLEMDNKGAVGLANNWSVGGKTRHVDIRQCFLGESPKLWTSIGLRALKMRPMSSQRI
jgi:hypothetical protein